MPYSDEPRIIKERPPVLKLAIGIAAVLVIAGTMLALVGGPMYHNYLRNHTPHGPHHGSVYDIKMEGQPYAMEIGREDYRFTFYFDPLPPQPEQLSIEVRLRSPDLSFTLPWNPDIQAYGPGEEQFDPMGDFYARISILRDGTRIWRGGRWAFGETGHHHHHH